MGLPLKIENEFAAYRKEHKGQSLLYGYSMPEMDFILEYMRITSIDLYKRTITKDRTMPNNRNSLFNGFFYSEKGVLSSRNHRKTNYYMEVECCGTVAMYGNADIEALYGTELAKLFKKCRTLLNNDLSFIQFIKSSNNGLIQWYKTRAYADVDKFMENIEELNSVNNEFISLFKQWKEIEDVMPLPKELIFVYTKAQEDRESIGKLDNSYMELLSLCKDPILRKKYELKNSKCDILGIVTRLKSYRNHYYCGLCINYIVKDIDNVIDVLYILNTLVHYMNIADRLLAKGYDLEELTHWASYDIYWMETKDSKRLATIKEKDALVNGIRKETRYYTTPKFVEYLAVLRWMYNGDKKAYKEFMKTLGHQGAGSTSEALLLLIRETAYCVSKVSKVLDTEKFYNLVGGLKDFYAERPIYPESAPDENIGLTREELVNWARWITPYTRNQRIALDIAQKVSKGLMNPAGISDKQLVVMQRAYEEVKSPKESDSLSSEEVEECLAKAREVKDNKTRFAKELKNYIFNLKVCDTVLKNGRVSEAQSGYIDTVYKVIHGKLLEIKQQEIEDNIYSTGEETVEDNAVYVDQDGGMSLLDVLVGDYMGEAD